MDVELTLHKISFSEQLYTPLSADKIQATASWEGERGGVRVDVRWCSEDTSNLQDYIVAIGSESCTLPERNPPCFIVRNAVSVYSEWLF